MDVETDTVVGKTTSIDELLKRDMRRCSSARARDFPCSWGFPASLSGVYSANEYLTRTNLMKAYREEYDRPEEEPEGSRGGRRQRGYGRSGPLCQAHGRRGVCGVPPERGPEMPARVEEIHHAKEEGIEFHLLTNPTQVWARAARSWGWSA